MADMNDLQAWANGKAGEEQAGQNQNQEQAGGEGQGEQEEQDDITPSEALNGACMEIREGADYLERAIAKMDDPGDLKKQVDDLRKQADDLEAKAEELAEETEEEEDEEEETEDGEGE